MPENFTDDKSALGLVMAWVLLGNKPLPKSMLTKFYDAIWRH